jgi:hypothetical protein
MSVETDDRGRIYLEKALRERYGEQFHIVTYRDRIELVPVDEDPLEGLREAVGDALEGKSVSELKDEARAEALEQATDRVRRG